MKINYIVCSLLLSACHDTKGAIIQDFLDGPSGSYVSVWTTSGPAITDPDGVMTRTQVTGGVGSVVTVNGASYEITSGAVITVPVGGNAQTAVTAAASGDQVVLMGGNYALIEFRSKTGVDLTCFPGATCNVLQIESLSGSGQTFACNNCGISNIRTQSASVGPWMHFGKVGTKTGLRIIGNHAEDVGNSASGALVTIKEADNTKILMNTSLNTGVSGANTAQNIYFGGEAVNAGLEIAWNTLRNHLGGRHIQIYGHTCGERLTGLEIHNNTISNDPGFSGGGNTGILVSHSDCAAGTNQSGDGWIVDASVHDNVVHDIASGNGIRYETSDLPGEPGTFATTTNNVIYNTGDAPIQVSYAKGNVSSGNCMEGTIDWQGPKASAYSLGGVYSSSGDSSAYPSCIQLPPPSPCS